MKQWVFPSLAGIQKNLQKIFPSDQHNQEKGSRFKAWGSGLSFAKELEGTPWKCLQGPGELLVSFAIWATRSSRTRRFFVKGPRSMQNLGFVRVCMLSESFNNIKNASQCCRAKLSWPTKNTHDKNKNVAFHILSFLHGLDMQAKQLKWNFVSSLHEKTCRLWSALSLSMGFTFKPNSCRRFYGVQNCLLRWNKLLPLLPSNLEGGCLILYQPGRIQGSWQIRNLNLDPLQGPAAGTSCGLGDPGSLN